MYDIKKETVDMAISDFTKASTYKFKQAFFRHERRTAPKFGTHVLIETVTLNKLIDPPHPMGG